MVYLRTDPRTGERYVGQSKSEKHFLVRQRRHDRRLGVEHIYDAFGRAKPGKEVDRLEESEIRRQGGVQKEGGTLTNMRHQMSEERFQQSGGMTGGEGQ